MQEAGAFDVCAMDLKIMSLWLWISNQNMNKSNAQVEDYPDMFVFAPKNSFYTTAVH